MRLKAGIWVKAYIRRCAGAGIPAAVVRHGDDDAGAIFIRVNLLNGTSRLFGPAPAGLDEAGRDRMLMDLFDGHVASDSDVEATLDRQRAFDPDMWIIEIEDRAGRHFLDDWLARSA